MKPEQFIREYGVKKARVVLTIVPENEYYFTSVMIKPCGNWVYSQIAQLTHHDGTKFNVSFKLLEEWGPKFVNLKDLKRLVESLDLVEYHGGFDGANGYLDSISSDAYSWNSNIAKYHGKLERAIKDHESIYGEQ